MRIVKPASANPVWDELEQLARRYRDLPPNPLPEPKAAGGAPMPPEYPERARLRQRIWQLMAGTWVNMVADEARASEPDAAELGAAEPDVPEAETTPAHPDNLPGQLLRRDSAVEQLFRIKAHKLAHQHGDWMLEAYGGPTNLSASAQQEFWLDKVVPMAQKRRVTLLSALIHKWDPATGKLETFLGVMAERFLIDLARRLGALEGDRRHTLEATPKDWVTPADAQGEDSAGKKGKPESLPLETWLRDEAATPQEAAEQGELVAALYAAVGQLPMQDRQLFQVWLAQCSQDWSDDIAARQAQLPRATYARRRDKLAKALRQQFA
jgi:hypothetical protein